MEPRVIYEDEHLAVLDKPAGWLTHADGRTSAPTVADWFAACRPVAAAAGEPMKLISGQMIARPGIVHRLDRGTSGAMVVVKDQPTYLRLRAAFAARLVRKSYRLLVRGLVRRPAGTIDLPIGRSRRQPGRRVASAGAWTAGRSRAALTNYQVLKIFPVQSGPGFTYLEAYPLTGRTHQLRAHFKSIGHPIVGDRLYNRAEEVNDLLGRPALHSYCLELPASDSVCPLIFIASLPPDFFSALASLNEMR